MTSDDGIKDIDHDRLQKLVEDSDLGGRNAQGATARILLVVAVAWSLFQLWYASPLPFALRFGVFNDTEARAIHLAFALFLAFTCYPAFATSQRDKVPVLDWVLALIAAGTSAYLFIFYRELALRPGQATTLDLTIAALGIVLLLEATRRALGMPMVIVALTFIAFTFLGPYMPEVIQHKGASLSRFLTHQWLLTEGVFGVALGVSTSFVFLFVLFGALLEKAGGGNYMMQLSVALLGHLRGGPAKVAVVSSALNGVVSGSSVSNVVSGGVFTIPMMKRTGLSGVKAGAIETASSINGQIMPPVMGAAAFLMTEFVGIPYSEIIKHAALPAIISYVSLFYIVHLEALKINSQPISRAVERPLKMRLLRLGLGWSSTIVVMVAIYYGILAVRALFGDAAGWLLGAGGIALYVGLIGYCARYPDLALDDPNAPIVRVPEAWPVARTGLHFLIPLVVLLWCLMVEELSPGLSAFYACVTILGITATQPVLFALFRRQDLAAALVRGVKEGIDGLNLGARNMIGLAVATATAGIVVGTITLTGLGLMMTDFVEFISGGNVILMLILTAFICLVLGMGIPTTASYILVATLIAPVIVELGAQADIAIPLIAVHLFVFYFGIMADVTPPVGLASFAAAAISGEDPIKTGLQGTVYIARTAILPFVFIFNPQLLLIDIGNVYEAVLVIATSTIAILVFAAATMNYFLVRNRMWETVALLVACVMLFRPGFFLDLVYDRNETRPAAEFMTRAAELSQGGRLLFRVEGLTLEGDEVKKLVSLNLNSPPGDARQRLIAEGLTVSALGEAVQITAVRFGSQAKRLRLEEGLDITGVVVPSNAPSKYWVFIPALALVGGVMWAQQRRRRDASAAPAAVPAQ